MNAPGRELAHVASAEARGADLLLVPVGSIEQHGPHLPLDTDTVIARAVALEVADLLTASGTTTWVSPAISLGSSGEHQDFCGTVSIGTEVLRLVAVETVRSARTWVPRVVFVNGHGGNLDALDSAVSQLLEEGHDVAWAPCAPPGADPHAGRTETSVMLGLRPESVRRDLVERGSTLPLRETLSAMRVGGVSAVSANGVLGDPTGATADEGRHLVAAMVDAVRAVASPLERVAG